MIIEEMIGSNMGGERESCDKFPIGMRVLAVDDDPTCLKLLDGLLKSCQYQVTTTSQARTALRMLREKKDRFDLVISDVHMPDMDGFKLLELVGLEMDLPVIMLSANSDYRLVMKGITHGACDYLVKPVRLEELKNIWQHVIRRKKVDPKNHNKRNDQDRANKGGSEDGRGPQHSGYVDQNGNHNKKRKDEEYESDENGNENDDPTTQKKPRVVWSIELHRKFVAAVNQLGLEKAVPKRILDLMNVDGLTRENVASHLQKYRLYLKKQANMVATLRDKDAYMRMGPLDPLTEFRTLTGAGRFVQPNLSPYGPADMLRRLNSPGNISLRNLPSSQLLQHNHEHLSNFVDALTKLNPIVPPNQNPGIFGIPASLELVHLQQSKCAPQIGEMDPLDDSGLLTSTSVVCSSNSSLPNASNNPMLLQVLNSQQPLNGGGFGNQHSLNAGPFSSGSFNPGVSVSSNFLDHGRNNESWQNSIPLTEPFSNSRLTQDRVRGGNTSAGPQLQNSSIEFSPSTIVSSSFEASREEAQCRESLGSVVQSLSQAPSQMWSNQKQHYSQSLNNSFSHLSSQLSSNGALASSNHSMDQNNEMFCRRVDLPLIARSNGGSSALMQHGESDKSIPELRTRTNEGYLLDTTKQHTEFLPRGYDSLDDLMSAMKREHDGAVLEGGEFGFDAPAAYSFGSGPLGI